MSHTLIRKDTLNRDNNKNRLFPLINRKFIYIIQNYFALKRLAEATLEIKYTDEEFLKLIKENINNTKDKGFSFKDIECWTLGKKIIAGMRNAIKDHGPITLESMNSAAKRIVGKIKERE